jgi:flavin reductase (DIM6/NTAB) family NADH-FMN oxidoreductase RutF
MNARVSAQRRITVYLFKSKSLTISTLAALAAAGLLFSALAPGAAAAGGDEGGGRRISLGAKTLASPCPVWVIGSYDAQGKPNAMTASWAGICCSRPPCVAVSLRAATYTHGNIMRSRAFTVSVPSESHASAAAYFGSVSGSDTDKFAATGLTAVRADSVAAPYVGEFPLVVECRLLHTYELGLHTMFIGEIVSVHADESIVNASGAPDLGKLRPILFGPGNEQFYGVGGPLGSMKDLIDRMK